MRTRNQEYAAKIFQQIERDIVPQTADSTYQRRYGSMAHKLPILIRKAGLVQALAFVEARGMKADKQLLEHIKEVIGEQELLKRSREAEMEEYIELTNKVLSALLWYKRFAQSLLNVDAGEDK